MSSAATCYSCVPGDTKDGMKTRQADRMAGCGDCLPASVNRSLLPLKLHFFLYLAAQACVYAYLAVIGRQNGISAANIAVIFGFTPLAAVLFKPVCGYIIDRTQNATGVILALQFFLIVSHAVVFFSPALVVQMSASRGLLNCPDGTFVLQDRRVLDSCLASFPTASAPLQCNLTFPTDHATSVDVNAVSGTSVTFQNATGVCQALDVVSKVAKGDQGYNCTLSCPCDADNAAQGSFWFYTVSVVIAWTLTATLFTVTDAAVCEVLAENVNAFGRQRLWGTISWGVTSPLIGFFIDQASTVGHTDYTPGFYVFAAFILLDMALIAYMPRLRTADLSVNFFRDITKLFCSVEVVTFTFWTFIVGALIGVIWSFGTWFLEDLGASKLLIGLTATVMSLGIELPLFFVSRNILERIGYFFSYSITFVCFAIKFIGYSFVRNAWYVLIIDIAGGAIFPLAYSAMTVFAKSVATPGTSASMLCILGASFEGLGVAAGNLLGGMSFDQIGGRLTFRYLGYASVACSVCCTATYLAIRGRNAGRHGSETPVLKTPAETSGNGNFNEASRINWNEHSRL